MTYSDYRRVARENLAGNWAQSIGTAALAWLLGGLLIGSSFLPEFSIRIDGQDISNLTDLLDLVSVGALSTIGLGSLLSLAQFIVGGAVQLGYSEYLLKQHNKANFEYTDLFSQFDRFGQGFAQKFLRSLYSFLWGLLFIIPGIVKGLAYSMTPFSWLRILR